MPSLLNRHQPTRPSVDSASGKRLLYRTYPMMKDSGNIDGRVYRVMEPANQLSQMQLYRWSRSDQFVNSPSISDLYDFLIREPFENAALPFTSSKHHFGRTITNALNYNPRKLKGKTKDNEKACQIYYFLNPLELQYGLEYMICAWLRKFLNDHAAPGGQQISGSDAMSEELDILCSTPWADYLEVYVNPLQMNRNLYPEPEWRKLLRQSTTSDEIPEIDAQEPRRKLRSFSAPGASE